MEHETYGKDEAWFLKITMVDKMGKMDGKRNG
ncbi:hypothetical protein C823_002887 [Eubacterium plexicaudatum ASF492]|uniref:Uncharacterized protein n=1 Tax=Eubacterium plexicaudatum ASF492 TaxID=1235802 RepID=N2AKB3_9FIRM|nr:hypothetical protein C823_002884 [Eubacterium plexicaudatum ASF492]KAI4448367.1 hypothetical protein C823_002887 [Eubacterium plexicaudatum ASF492]